MYAAYLYLLRAIEAASRSRGPAVELPPEEPLLPLLPLLPHPALHPVAPAPLDPARRDAARRSGAAALPAVVRPAPALRRSRA